MSLFSLLKRNAKLALKGNWGRAIPILLISIGSALLLAIVRSTVLFLFIEPVSIDPTLAMRYGFSEYFFEHYLYTTIPEIAVTAGFTILDFLLLVPLNMGIIRWFYRLVKGQPEPVGSIFCFYENGARYGRMLLLQLHLFVRTLLWCFVFFLLPFGIYFLSVYVITNEASYGSAMVSLASAGLFFATILIILASFLFFAFTNRYLLAPYIACEDEERPVRAAIRDSIEYTRGYRFSLLWFSLSFIGWILLCVFIGPVLYVAPYFSTAIAMYAHYIIEKNRTTDPETTREFQMEQPEPEPFPLPDPEPDPEPEPDAEPEAQPAPKPEPEPTPEPAPELAVELEPISDPDDFHFPNP